MKNGNPLHPASVGVAARPRIERAQMTVLDLMEALMDLPPQAKVWIGLADDGSGATVTTQAFTVAHSPTRGEVVIE